MITKILCPVLMFMSFSVNIHAQPLDIDRFCSFYNENPLILTSPVNHHGSVQIGLSIENLFRNHKITQYLHNDLKRFRIVSIFPEKYLNKSLWKPDLYAGNIHNRDSDKYISRYFRIDTCDQTIFGDDKPVVSMDHFKSLNIGLKQSVPRMWRYYKKSLWRIRMDRAPEGKKLINEIRLENAVR